MPHRAQVSFDICGGSTLRAAARTRRTMARISVGFVIFCELAALLGMACGLASASEVRAQGLMRVQGPPLRQACLPDYMRYCRGVPVGGGRILRCLNGHVDQLSQPCFQALALRGLATAGALRICGLDYERLCPNVPLDRDRAIACLLDQVPALSPACREAFERNGLLDEEPPVPPAK